MSLLNTVDTELKNAMRNPEESEKRDVLRQVISKAKLTAKEDKTRTLADREVMTEADLLGAIQKHVKQSKEAVEVYKTSTEAIAQKNMEKELREIKILSAFLPQQMSEFEIIVLVDNIFLDLNITEKDGKAKGMVMKELGKYKDELDMKFAASVVANKMEG